MAFEQEVSYCLDCQEAFYPVRLGPCACNNKYRMIIKVALREALEISKLLEDTNIHVYIREGKLVSSHGSVREAGEGVAGNGDDFKRVRTGEALSDHGGETASVSEGSMAEGTRADSDSGNVVRTAKMGDGNGRGDRGGAD